jgi:hypothetical protein
VEDVVISTPCLQRPTMATVKSSTTLQAMTVLADPQLASL